MGSAFLPAPYAGVNEYIPVSEITAPNCEELLNFNVDQGGISLRNGDSVYSRVVSGVLGDFMCLAPYGESGKLYAALKDPISHFVYFIDCDDGSVDYTTINSVSTTTLASVYFDRYLFFYGNTATLAPGITFDGTNWTTCGYTANTGTLNPIGGNVFNHRQFLIQLNDAGYYYSGIDSISGVCFYVSLNGLTESNTTLSCIGAFTHVSAYGASTNYQSFIMANGEVLFFSGDYPDSDNWTLAGKANIAQPLSPNSVIPYQGDTLVLTDSGPVSLRSLFLVLRDVTQTSSEEAPSLTLSAYCQRSWDALVRAIRISLSSPTGPITPGAVYGAIRGVFDKKNNRIVISFPYYLDSSGVLQHGSFFFIYDNLQKAWFFHRSFGGTIFDICRYKNSIKMFSHVSSSDVGLMIYDKEGSTGFTDRDNIDNTNIGYDFEMKSAPIPYKKDAVYTIDGLEPIITSDMYAQTNWTLIADFGRQTTSPQVLSDSMGTTIVKSMVNIGITANFAQVRMYGTTAASKTVGLSLSGYNAWFDAGQKESR